MTRPKLIASTALAFLAAFLLVPTEAAAQRRVVRRAPVRTTVVVGVGGYYSPYYYRPWLYDPWFYGYPYGWYPPHYYGHAAYAGASLRLQVEPKETEVFIDGYWAGIVDDFDGFFQRLRLEPGEHEVELYLEGHRSLRQKVYLQPNATFRIRHTMVPLAPGDTPDPRPAAPAQPPPRPQRPYDALGRPTERPEPPERARERMERPEPLDFGSLAIRVQPADAEILIDGEAWQGPERAERLVVELPEGEHRVEVRKAGFTSYASSVRVRRGETTTLNVSLTRE